MPPLMEYGDISPRTAAYVAKDLLKRGIEIEVIGRWGQMVALPGKNTKSIKFRRYNALALATTALTEGVTPPAKKLTYTDVDATLKQYGDVVEHSDVIEDTHEDPIVKEKAEILGEQSVETIETVRFNVLKAGTNLFLANGVARTDVNTPVTLSLQKKIVRALKRQRAKKHTKAVSSEVRFNTESIPASFIAIAHTDLENDIRDMKGFIDAKDYGNGGSYPGEIGAVNDVRYLLSTVFTSYVDGGGAYAGSGVNMVTTSGVSADVYPIIYIGRDSWAGVALRGKFAVTPSMISAGRRTKSDPLGQRGYGAWKTMQSAVILNDAWMAVAEVAATDL